LFVSLSSLSSTNDQASISFPLQRQRRDICAEISGVGKGHLEMPHATLETSSLLDTTAARKCVFNYSLCMNYELMRTLLQDEMSGTDIQIANSFLEIIIYSHQSNASGSQPYGE